MESKNLIVRETVFDDCKYFAEWETWPQVTEFFTMDEERSYEQVVTEFVRNNLDPSKLQFTITLKPQDKPIGKIFCQGSTEQMIPWILPGYTSQM